MDIKTFVLEKAQQAKASARSLATASTELKNDALTAIADAFQMKSKELIAANAQDILYAEQKGLSRAIIDRLTLSEQRIKEMADGLREVAKLPDPVGEIIKMQRRPNGMMVGRMRVPIGVIAMIYESRPNVTADASSLCLKAGNAVILRGGSESINSNRVIVKIMQDVVASFGLPPGIITYLDAPGHEAILEMIKLESFIDLVIPRGGEGLIRTIVENSKIPVLKHYKGVCHIFVDRNADLNMAETICFNAKVQRPGTCNAMETLLVDSEIAKQFLPDMLKKYESAGVTVKGCQVTRALWPHAEAVNENDYAREYLDLIVNVRVVKDIHEAIDHIAKYSSLHTDAIITDDYAKAMHFVREVDSSAVMVNASTRLNDGFQFGLGAEIGISTDKIHARGPMGLEELTCTKFVVFGNGNVRK
jgi:glutamate-5-semialdehyde dehydrogenase